MMTNQPNERWLRKAGELLPCCGNCFSPDKFGHSSDCIARKQEAVARFGQEAFEAGRATVVTGQGPLPDKYNERLG